MNTFFTVITCIAGLYLLLIGVMIRTHTLASGFVFKFVPVTLGTFLMIFILAKMGLLAQL